MALGRPPAPLALSADERNALERWVRRRKTAQALALRARIVLGADAGKTKSALAAELGETKQTVGKWRQRFVERGLDGLLDEPRPGAPRTISDEDVERVLTLTLEEDAGRRDALEHAFHGQARRTQPKRYQPHLARFCTSTQPLRDLQLEGAAWRRSAMRYR